MWSVRTADQLAKAANEMGLPLLASLPMNSDVARLCDSGEIEKIVCDELASAADTVEALLK